MKTMPLPTKKRLIKLAQLLFQANDKKNITSLEIQALSGWSPATIRKDISYIDVKCGASNGYKKEELRYAIIKLLNLQNNCKKKKCCIVGLGTIGEALLKYTGFENSQFELIVGFDSNVNKTEILDAPFPLYSSSRLETIIKKEAIEYAILSVNDEDAQEIANRLSECNIKGIVNYTNTVVSLPAETAVKNVSIISALQNLV